MAYLEVVVGAHTGTRFALGDELHLGRNPGAAPDPRTFLPLSDAEVSRVHARIRRLGRGYVVEDLDSTNGTWLRGERIKPHVPYLLREGDELRLGGTVLRFRLGGPAEEAGMPRYGSAIMARPAGVGADTGVEVREETSGERSVVIDPRELAPPSGAAEAVMRRLQAVSAVSRSLGEVQDLRRLAEGVLERIFEIFPTARRALIALVGEGGQVRPLAVRGRDGGGAGRLALSSTVVREVLNNRRAVLTLDARSDPRFRAGESVARLSLQSLMCAPLLVEERVVGLVQVEGGAVEGAFDEDDLRVLAGVAAQIAVAVHNARLYGEIEALFESFIRASVQAIEARDPVTAGHSFRVAEFAERLAEAADRAGVAGLGREAVRELRYAALLHDFGKVGVREHVLTKPTKLYPHQMELVRMRFRYARAAFERDAYRRLLDLWAQGEIDAGARRRMRGELERMLREEAERFERMLAAVEEANRPDVPAHALAPGLEEAEAYRFPGLDGAEEALLTPGELLDLRTAQGSLSPDERLQIESHVSHTYAFLSLIPWRGDLARVPEIAYGHHEKLDGSGYPRGLRGEDIPVQTRILTIADIYDAVTAGDRPYRRGLPQEQALELLEAQARAGALDAALVGVFIEARVYVR
ncbi:HD domain-containing phosphohydrolase [Inmirania thermothiophila]|uniref:3',5'-cyclic-nucleotide phosphodiesterase n=1 Tax=Inmirania thermothiophila TaxID=1750597 RepID=A0A3N1Y014_9GAMM|nr:HD domain-containing phosphohydrolase [Inmirania thermothiophila]ROR32160.1 3',5'-cyclic-nucleotide phosphodiesterase [Inmirania thermothiophila]